MQELRALRDIFIQAGATQVRAWGSQPIKSLVRVVKPWSAENDLTASYGGPGVAGEILAHWLD